MSAGQCPCGRPTDEGVRFCETCEPTPPPGDVPCGDRVTRNNGDWRPCDLPKGHGIVNGLGCTTHFAGDPPVWNPRDVERRKHDRRYYPAPTDDITEAQAREYEALLFGARWTVGSDHPGCICANCKTDMWREYRETRSTELL